MNLEDIKKSKQEMESKIYEAINDFESKTGLAPHSINLEYKIGGGKHIFMVKSQVEL